MKLVARLVSYPAMLRGIILPHLGLAACTAIIVMCVPTPGTAQDRVPGEATAVEPTPADPAIVPQSEIDQAVPDLPPERDPALSAPLESIEDLGKPETGGEAASPAPGTDPEMSSPLPPLGELEFPASSEAAAGPANSPAALRFAMRVEGLEPADAETDIDLASRFQDLSVLDDAKGKALNQAMLIARLREDGNLLQRLLFAEGWYDAGIETRIDRQPAGADAPLVAVLSVTPGQRYRIGQIALDAEPTVPPGLIADNLPLTIGEPVVAERIEAAEARLALVLPQQGYPFAELGKRNVLLDRETHLGEYSLPISIGPRARFGDVTTQGNLAFDAGHAALLARFKRGDLYDSRKLDDLREALIATSLFSSVAVTPRRTGEAAGEGTEYVLVDVT